MNAVVIVRLLAVGLLPALFFGAWELRLRRGERRSGLPSPVSAEGLRWLLYAAGAYELCYAGLAVAWLDGRHVASAPALIAAVVFIMLATGVLLWDLGTRYAPRIPRLDHLRIECYRARLVLTRRARLLRWYAYRFGGMRGELTDIDALVADCGEQLHRLQRAMSTEVFLRRVRRDPLARAEVEHILAAQHRMLRDAQRCLLATAPLAVLEPALEPIRVA